MTGRVTGFALLVSFLISCTASSASPRWVEKLEEQLACGMSLREIRALTDADIVEAARPWGTHFIRRRLSDLWLQVTEQGLESIQESRIDGWRIMSTRSSPQKNLCTGGLTFFVRIVWTYELQGAQVYLDGGRVQPADWAGPLLKVPAGRHELRIEKDGHEPIIKALDFGPDDRGDQRLDLTKEPAPTLGIEVEVEQRRVGSEWHPVAGLAIQNTSSERVAFTRTFGITNQPWMTFEIEAADGSPVYYPSEVDAFRRRPSYICLQPGEVLAWEIDVLNWRVVFEDEPWGEPVAFDLRPGLYRLRAQYTDDPPQVRARCPGPKGTFSSSWVEFSVNPEGPR